MAELLYQTGMSRYYSNCVCCGREGRIKKMYCIYARPPENYAAPKLLAHICPECMPKFLDDLEVAMPE